MQAVGSDPTGLAAQFSDGKRVRDVYTDYAIYKSTPLPFFFITRVPSATSDIHTAERRLYHDVCALSDKPVDNIIL